MSKSLSLEKLSDYITENVGAINAVRQEMEEIQIGFNSAYVEWKAKHDATLERLTEAITDGPGEVGPDLQRRVEERAVEERRTIAERRQELRDRLIPETQVETDGVLDEGRRLSADLRQVNPRLDEREEKLKAQRAKLEGELSQLNDQVRRSAGCLGVIINFRKLRELDRQRQRVIGKLEAVQQEIQKVRQRWQRARNRVQEDQGDLQTWWQEATLKLAQLQAELDYLDDEASREALARKRAARHVIDHLKEPLPCPIQELKQELDDMVQFNIQTDDYQEALGSVSGLMSLLEGIADGLKRFDASVQGLINQQKMHSAYLSRLDVTVSDEVRAFHAQWNDLRHKVQDERRLCAHPTEFMAAVEPVIEKDLSEANVKAMFESLGQSLTQATRKWRKR
jgi:predicted nuclease with TOPRIM domain